MKLIHTSDWHLGKSLFDYSLLEDQAHFLSWLLELLKEEEIDALLISGDIYHRPIPPAAAVSLLDDFLAKAVLEHQIPVLAVAGNHDSGARLEFGGSLLEAAGYHIAGRPRRELHQVTLEDEAGPVSLWLLPYLFPADVRSLLPDCQARTFQEAYTALLEENRAAFQLPHRKVMLSHGFFTGASLPIPSESEVTVGGMETVESAIFAPFDYVALGHLHAPQPVGEGIRYSGSPLAYSLSEERQRKSVTLVELHPPGQGATTREILVPALRHVRRIKGSFEELMEPAFHQNRAFGDYVFAEITNHGALYPVEKLRTLFPRLLGVSFPALEHTVNLEEIGAARNKLTLEEHFLRFYREMTGTDLEPEPLAIFREIASEMTAPEEVSS